MPDCLEDRPHRLLPSGNSGLDDWSWIEIRASGSRRSPSEPEALADSTENSASASGSSSGAVSLFPLLFSFQISNFKFEIKCRRHFVPAAFTTAAQELEHDPPHFSLGLSQHEPVRQRTSRICRSRPTAAKAAVVRGKKRCNSNHRKKSGGES